MKIRHASTSGSHWHSGSSLRWILFVTTVVCAPGCGKAPSTETTSAASKADTVKTPSKVRAADPGREPVHTAVDIPLTQSDDKTLYTLGHSVMLELTPYNLTERELKIVQMGMRDTMSGELKVNPAEFMPKMQILGQERVNAQAEQEKRAGAAYLEASKKKPGAQVSPSGMVYFLETPGRGPRAQPNQNVEIHLRGTLVDGTEIEDTRQLGQTKKLPLNRGLPCWIDGLTQLGVGGKITVVCPPTLAYGIDGFAPFVPPQATVIFELELVGFFEGVPQGTQ